MHPRRNKSFVPETCLYALNREVDPEQPASLTEYLGTRRAIPRQKRSGVARPTDHPNHSRHERCSLGSITAIKRALVNEKSTFIELVHRRAVVPPAPEMCGYGNSSPSPPFRPPIWAARNQPKRSRRPPFAISTVGEGNRSKNSAAVSHTMSTGARITSSETVAYLRHCANHHAAS